MSKSHDSLDQPTPDPIPAYEATAWDRFIQHDPKISYNQGMMALLDRSDVEIQKQSRGMARTDLLGTIYRGIRFSRMQRKDGERQKRDVL